MQLVSAPMHSSQPRVSKNVYYITGFLGNQAAKAAKSHVKGSSVKICMTYIASSKFPTRSNGHESELLNLIADNDIPTEMVQKRESFGGLHYVDGEC